MNFPEKQKRLHFSSEIEGFPRKAKGFPERVNDFFYSFSLFFITLYYREYLYHRV